MFDDLVEYVRENYSRASKIVELGVGSRIDVAERSRNIFHGEFLSRTRMKHGSEHTTSQVRAVADDVCFADADLSECVAALFDSSTV